MKVFRHLHMGRNGPYWLKLALWFRLFFCTAFPVHLLWVWLFSLLFWPHTMKQESEFFFEDKAAFYKTMNVYFSWEGSHSALLICWEPSELPLISVSLSPFTWTHLKTPQFYECPYYWLSHTGSQRITVLCEKVKNRW